MHFPLCKGAAVVAALFLIAPCPADALRIMTYNVLEVNVGSTREPDFEVILEYAQPDAIVVQEIASQAEERGEHDAAWDGRDERGRSSAAGIYFVRLASIDGSWTEKIIRVK